MIRVLITRKGESIVRAEVKGHANYAEYGKDIVCSGVSAIVQTAGLSAEPLGARVSQSDGHYIIDVGEFDCHDMQVLLKVMEKGVKAIADNYPKNIKMEEKVL